MEGPGGRSPGNAVAPGVAEELSLGAVLQEVTGSAEQASHAHRELRRDVSQGFLAQREHMERLERQLAEAVRLLRGRDGETVLCKPPGPEGKGQENGVTEPDSPCFDLDGLLRQGESNGSGADSASFDMDALLRQGESADGDLESESGPHPVGRLSWFEDDNPRDSRESWQEAHHWSFVVQSKSAGSNSDSEQRSMCRKVADWIIDQIIRFESIKEPERKDSIARFEEYTRPLFLCIIVLHCGWMVHAVNYEAANPDEPMPDYFQNVEIALVSIYSVELVLRLAVHRMYYFINENARWNIMDMLLVASSIIGFTLEGEGGEQIAFLRGFRIFKAGRVLRIFRVVRFLDKLRLILTCLLNSIMALVWSIVMMVVVFFMFSILFVQGTAAHLRSSDGGSYDDFMREKFGSVQASLLSLYMVTTGVDWSPYYATAQALGSFHSCVWLFFIAFTQIALLNVLTSIFVESALKIAEPDHVDKALLHAAYDQEIVIHLRALLYDEFGLTGHAVFPVSTFFQNIRGTKLDHYMHFIGVNTREMERLMKMIQSTGRSAEITTDAFIKGCMKVRGEARSLDMQHLLLAVQFMQKNQAEMRKNQVNMQKNQADLRKTQADILSRISNKRALLPSQP